MRYRNEILAACLKFAAYLALAGSITSLYQPLRIEKVFGVKPAQTLLIVVFHPAWERLEAIGRGKCPCARLAAIADDFREPGAMQIPLIKVAKPDVDMTALGFGGISGYIGAIDVRVFAVGSK